MITELKKTNRNKWGLFLLVLIAAVVNVTSVFAQYGIGRPAPRSNFGFQSPAFFVGVEAVAGIRSFSLNGDIKQFNDVSVVGQGQSVGLVAGSNALLVKVRFGDYGSSHATNKEIDMKETTVSVNVSPFQLINKRSKQFEPYFLTDIDVNNVSLSGSPLPKKALTPAPPKPPCDDSHGLPGDPDAASGPGSPAGPPPPNPGPNADPDDQHAKSESGMQYIGTIKAVRASAGVGLICNINGKRTFAKLFTEVKYGTSFKTTSTNLDLRGTKVSEQVTINFGVMMGLNAALFGR